jgi:uncharacterized repeat protein (TIGR03803 family)
MNDNRDGGARVRAREVLKVTALAAAVCLASAAAQAAPSTIELIYSLAGGEDGHYSDQALVEYNGMFYGAAYSECGTLYSLTPPPSAKGFTLSMRGGFNGCMPKSLVVGADGNLYGVAESFGSTITTDGYGTLFRITPAGELTRLHVFDGKPGHPLAGLVAGRDGAFYGTTSTWNLEYGGTVFRMTTDGNTANVTHLHTFGSGPGVMPRTALVEDVIHDGVFYGTTSGHGVQINSGTLFKITSAGEYTHLHSFFRENERPSGPLVQAGDGMLYGSTTGGGANQQGMVFRIDTDGENFEILHDFDLARDQLTEPSGGLVRSPDGYLYGAAGGIYRVDPNTGKVARLLSAAEVKAVAGSQISGNDSRVRLTTLLRGSDNAYYAVSAYGGAVNCNEPGATQTFGCGGVVRIVPGDPIELGSGGAGGSGGSGGSGSGSGGSGSGSGGSGGSSSGSDGGGGDGTTLAVLALLLAGLFRRQLRGRVRTG